MGYDTQYSLTWEMPTPSSLDECFGVSAVIARWIAGNEEANYALNENGTTKEPGRWYEWQQDLRTLSATLPKVKFILEGYGEEAGDIWRGYAKAGKVEQVKAELKFKVPGFFKLNH